jgi:hypothetical protein
VEKPSNKIVKLVVQCPKCNKEYKIDSSKVTEKGARATCLNCAQILIIRKDAKEEKEDFVQCSNCSEPATIHQDTDKLICERCKTLQEEKAARFLAMIEGKEALSRLAGALSLLSDGGQSFMDLFGGDFSEVPSAAGQKLNIVSGDKLDEAFYQEISDTLDRGDFYQEESSTDVPPDQDKKHLPPEEKPASSPEPQLEKPQPPEKAAHPPETPGPPQAAAPESAAPPKEPPAVEQELKIFTSDKLNEALYEEILDALARGGIWRGLYNHKILFKTGPDSPPDQLGPGPKTEEVKPLKTAMVSLIMVIAAETQRSKIEWFSFLALADRANEGFLSIARSSGKAIRLIQSGTKGGLSKIKHGLSRGKKEKKIEQSSRTRKTTAESDIEGLTREELIGIIDKASMESGINIRDFIKILE